MMSKEESSEDKMSLIESSPVEVIVQALPEIHRSHTIDSTIDFVGGVAGGTASVLIGQPLDTVKVKVQTFPKLYKNARDCFTITLKQEGIYRGLYAGTVPNLVAQVSENAVLFLFYGISQKAVANACGYSDVNKLSPLLNATAGFLAAFWSSLVLCPTELVKCRLQTLAQKEGVDLSTKKIGAWQLTREIIKTEGVQGMFRGLVPTFAREMPGYFFFFGGYELSRYMITPPGKNKDDIGALGTMACGAFGGCCLWTAIFPADVIKSRAQVQAGPSSKQGFVNTLLFIARKEGVRALYQGLAPTLLRTVPATAGLFLAYETTKSTLSTAVYGRHGAES